MLGRLQVLQTALSLASKANRRGFEDESVLGLRDSVSVESLGLGIRNPVLRCRVARGLGSGLKLPIGSVAHFIHRLGLQVRSLCLWASQQMGFTALLI